MNAWAVRADARAIPLRHESVDCVVTSPPYWGLRDYGTARWDGGDEVCDHVEIAVGVSDKNTLGPDGSSRPPTNAANVGRVRQYRDTCGKCGAKRIDAQLGLEASPQEYVAGLVAVFAECWRVLRPAGVAWLNLGDSYASDTKGSGGPAPKQDTNVGNRFEPRHLNHGLKAKDLVGIPWHVAFALQAAGWWLRSDIVWAKPNPMPESVTDRPTRSHEYIFLLAKSERYWYDAEAIAETAIHAGVIAGSGPKMALAGDAVNDRRTGKLQRQVVGETRNARSVWTIATQPYSGAHFATFPQELARRCILAGCPAGGVVLDPFAGSGTVGRVAIENGRNAVLCDLAYQDLAARRITNVQRPLMVNA